MHFKGLDQASRSRSGRNSVEEGVCSDRSSGELSDEVNFLHIEEISINLMSSQSLSHDDSDVDDDSSSHSSREDGSNSLEEGFSGRTSSGLSDDGSDSGSEIEGRPNIIVTEEFDMGGASIQSSTQASSNSQPQQHSAPNTNALVPTDLKSDVSTNDDDDMICRHVSEQDASRSTHKGNRQDPISLRNDPTSKEELEQRSARVLQDFIRNKYKKRFTTPKSKGTETPFSNTSKVSSLWSFQGEIHSLAKVDQQKEGNSLPLTPFLQVFLQESSSPLNKTNLLIPFNDQSHSDSPPQPPVRKLESKSLDQLLKEDAPIIERVIKSSDEVTQTVGDSGSTTSSQISFLSNVSTSSLDSDSSQAKKRSGSYIHPEKRDKKEQDRLKLLRRRRRTLMLKKLNSSITKQEQQEFKKIQLKIDSLIGKDGSGYTTEDELTVSSSTSEKQSLRRIQSVGGKSFIAFGSSIINLQSQDQGARGRLQSQSLDGLKSDRRVQPTGGKSSVVFSSGIINPKSQDQGSRKRLQSQSLDGSQQDRLHSRVKVKSVLQNAPNRRGCVTVRRTQSLDSGNSTKSYSPLREKIRTALALSYPSSSDSNLHPAFTEDCRNKGSFSPPGGKLIILTDEQKKAAIKTSQDQDARLERQGFVVSGDRATTFENMLRSHSYDELSSVSTKGSGGTNGSSRSSNASVISPISHSKLRRKNTGKGRGSSGSEKPRWK